MNNKEAAAYLRPIADSATMPNYQQALSLAIEALETVDELRVRGEQIAEAAAELDEIVRAQREREEG